MYVFWGSSDIEVNYTLIIVFSHTITFGQTAFNAADSPLMSFRRPCAEHAEIDMETDSRVNFLLISHTQRHRQPHELV